MCSKKKKTESHNSIAENYGMGASDSYSGTSQIFGASNMASAGFPSVSPSGVAYREPTQSYSQAMPSSSMDSVREFYQAKPAQPLPESNQNYYHQQHITSTNYYQPSMAAQGPTLQRRKNL